MAQTVVSLFSSYTKLFWRTSCFFQKGQSSGIATISGSVCSHFFLFVLIQLKHSSFLIQVTTFLFIYAIDFGYTYSLFFFIGMRGEPGNKASSLSSSGIFAAIVP